MFKNKIIPINKSDAPSIELAQAGLRPFDLILFKGSDVVGSSIRFFERYELGAGAGQISHVGMIITTEIFSIINKNYKNEMKLKEGELYIWESTKLGGEVRNIDNKIWMGCQIRNFKDVLASYLKNPSNGVYVKKVLDNPLDSMPINDIREKMAFLIGRFNGKPYVVNPMELFAGLFSYLRPLRNNYTTKTFIFCSELVGIVYAEFGIIKPDCNVADIVPGDFVVNDQDGAVDLSKFGEMVALTL